MLSYKDFKKEYLNEWVDRSQAARKAAEEFAMKDTASLRDKYACIFDLAGHTVEFKGENEMNPNNPIHNFFTYEEAKNLFGKPDEYGWRLPTLNELKALKSNYLYKFDKENKQGVFDNHLYLPAAGFRNCDGGVDDIGSDGCYWSSTPYGPDRVWYLYFFSNDVYISTYFRCCGFSVRLVRDVK